MKPGAKGLVLNRVDCCAAIVFETLKMALDNQKRYRFTLPVSKSRMLRALSVDALCSFGAKKLHESRKAVFLPIRMLSGCAEMVRAVTAWRRSAPKTGISAKAGGAK